MLVRTCTAGFPRPETPLPPRTPRPNEPSSSSWPPRTRPETLLAWCRCSPRMPSSPHHLPAAHIWGRLPRQARSEEHTSELQSRVDLVCRLLLEKKKKGGRSPHRATKKKK